MRWLLLILVCGTLTATLADPDPKKYKPENKNNKNNTTLSEEERKFLREVEAKFGIKSDIPIESNKKEDEQDDTNSQTSNIKPPFPVVIAFEIVNDTDSNLSNTKGKRTIDANLGYGYRTNNGYTYTYFGKQEDKGKYMIYPYSQEDIPPTRSYYQNYKGPKPIKNPHIYTPSTKQYGKYTTPTPNVEIQPSQAYELVPVQDEQPKYQNKQPNINTKLKPPKGKDGASPHYAVNESSDEKANPQTLYTLYNGGHLSGLSNQFPMVMPNYFVDQTQLLHNPHYQSAGLTSDHLRSHGAQQNQQVVPVLVLRVPSSYLKNPSAELYANIPKDYPLSNYLKNVNIQELVNEYFKNIGYSYAPQVMTYQSPIPVPSTMYDNQHYASPHVNPAYTHEDYSGVQYSAVQPVMAKYPIPNRHMVLSQQQYYVPQSQFPQQQYYKQQPQYEYQYVQPTQQAYYYPQYEDQQFVYQQPGGAQENPTQYYVPQSNIQYVSEPPSQTAAHQAQQQPQYVNYESENQEPADAAQYERPKFDYSTYKTIPKTSGLDAGPTKVSLPVYDAPKTTPKERESSKSVYGPPKVEYRSKTASIKSSNTPYNTHKTLTAAYLLPKAAQQSSPNSVPAQYSLPQSAHSAQHASSVPSFYMSSNTQYADPNTESIRYDHYKTQVEYGVPETKTQKETLALFSPASGQGSYQYEHVNPTTGATQSVIYQNYIGSDSQGKSLVISENYPSNDHSQVTVLPFNYQAAKSSGTTQTVDYVTPVPFASKYQHPYKVMVPQTVLKNDEKVSYVNAHSAPYHYAYANAQYASEEEYKLPANYVPPEGNQKAPTFPENYHAIPKRMAAKIQNKKDVKPEEKKETQSEKKETKKS